MAVEPALAASLGEAPPVAGRAHAWCVVWVAPCRSLASWSAIQVGNARWHQLDPKSSKKETRTEAEVEAIQTLGAAKALGSSR